MTDRHLFFEDHERFARTLLAVRSESPPDRAAFLAFSEFVTPRLWRITQNRLRSTLLAGQTEDVVSTSWEKLVRKLDTFRWLEPALRTWLQQTTKRNLGLPVRVDAPIDRFERLAVFLGEQASVARIEAAQRGSPEALGELVRLHRATVVTRIQRHLAVERSGEIEPAFERAVEALPSFRPRAPARSFRSWFGLLALRVAHDAVRAVVREPRNWADPDPDLDSYPAPPLPQPRLLDHPQARRALQRLSWNDRVLLVLRERAGLELAEIARVLGIKEGTVKSRLYRREPKGAIEKLKQLLGAESSDD